jgi:hypothetical protein
MLDCRFRFCAHARAPTSASASASSSLSSSSSSSTTRKKKKNLAEGFDVDLVELLAGLDLSQQRRGPGDSAVHTPHTRHDMTRVSASRCGGGVGLVYLDWPEEVRALGGAGAIGAAGAMGAAGAAGAENEPERPIGG